jgi:hypothetical protein
LLAHGSKIDKLGGRPRLEDSFVAWIMDHADRVIC